jgi:hypothetical protein
MVTTFMVFSAWMRGRKSLGTLSSSVDAAGLEFEEGGGVFGSRAASGA